MVCGLHMAVAARATYSLHQARQLLKEDALSNPEQDADPLLQVSVIDGNGQRGDGVSLHVTPEHCVIPSMPLTRCSAKSGGTPSVNASMLVPLQSIVQMVLPSKLGVTCLVVGLLLGLYIPNLSAW
jgi:hypothetical protein